MRCPFCHKENSQVKDSRTAHEGRSIRRRRECPDCDARFTTYERIELQELVVIKHNGRKEPFYPDKIRRAMQVSLRKRPFDQDKVEEFAEKVIRHIEMQGKTEIHSYEIGEKIMNMLQKIDQVAYIRFASVYRNFVEAQDFNDFIKKTYS